MSSETYGNSLVHAMTYNSRLQPTDIKLGTSTTADSILKLNYLYGTATNATDADGSLITTANNGNVARIKYTINGTLQYSQTYQYDGVNRLSYGVEHNNGTLNDSNRSWWQVYAYDRWGNRGIDTSGTSSSSNVGAGSNALQLSEFSSSTNRITRTGHSYDNAGNLTAEPSGNTYSYDGENKMITATVSSVASAYWYDADGRRVKKVVGSTGTRFIYNAAGQMVAEYTDSGTLNKEYVYKGGELLATIEPTNIVTYATADHLGTPRVWTNSSGAIITGGRHDYAPFGEELLAGIGVRSTSQGYAGTAQVDGQRKQFVGKERDAETGLDYFLARYHGYVQGRFTSTDPVLLTAYRLFNPQSFNLYAYVVNNPLKFADPDGKEIRFKTEEEADQAIARIRTGLAKDQRSAVSYQKTKDGKLVLKIDAKAAEKAGGDSLLGRLNTAATSSLVGQIEFVNQTDKVTIIKLGAKQEKSLADLGEDASDAITVTSFKGVTLFENTFDRTRKIYFQQIGLNSDTPGVSRILISKQQTTESMTEAVFHETLAHFETAIKGDASGRLTGANAKHPGVNADSAKISNAVQLNRKQK